MDFKHNPRFAYQGIRGRPDFAWPGRPLIIDHPVGRPPLDGSTASASSLGMTISV
jgi:hypothetical protein